MTKNSSFLIPNSSLQKPARYTGGEFNSVTKNFDAVDCRIVLALPDVYEVGMSNLGLAILYSILNRRADTLCERVYAPWIDAEKTLRDENIPLFALESKRNVKDFDFLGFSLQYEMIFTNVLNMLDLAKISLHAVDRADDEPFVVGGGPCVYNVEPVADFFDFFIVGEAEEVFGEVVDVFTAWKNSGRVGGRKNFLRQLLNVKGIYVPSFYEPIYDGEKFAGMKLLEPNAPQKIFKRVVKDFDATPTVENPVVPFLEIVHDRAMLELFRGCSRGCRFCQAGMSYRPVRERSKETLRKTARRLIDSSGWDEISLTSLSSADYSCLGRLIDDLQKDFRDEKVSFSLPSLRVDSFSIELAEKVQAVRKSGLTFAPEAGTQRLRDVINKNVTEKNLLDACGAAFAKGWKTVKLYFMMGLPTETDDDLRGIADLAQKVAALYREIKNRRDVKVTVSVSCFVPKPWTPFQWTAQISAEEFERRQKFLREVIRDKAITFNWHNAKLSVLEGALARGDRRLSKVIETAWRNGAKFDGWSDLFKPEIWNQAFETCGIDPKNFSERERELWEPLPWDHTSPAVNKSFLQAEWEKSQVGETTRDCRRTSCTGCGVCMNLGVNVVTIRNEELGVRNENVAETIPNSSLLIPNCKYRAQIRKGKEISVLSHLDYMNVFMRALLRSKLPAAWSEGFNPHLKVSFATALAVGVTSDCEYVDFELTAPVDAAEVSKRLNEQLPKGAEILRLKKLRGKVQPVMSLVDLSRYEVRLPFDEKFFDAAQISVKNFNDAPEIKFTRVTPKKTRELDAKKYLAEPVKIFLRNDELLIKFSVRITPEGSFKPSEVLKILREQFDFPVDVSDAKINRTKLLHGGKNLLDV
ncbi:MAG: TIGR03960 family B12-binding radical SAM protein [Selenomonadaceae bacterium]|nr:TIGR03960 family B12-binding radical SAM protein [Selenomonadaceae bacterium]